MTISEIRRLNLRALIKEHGSAAALCQRVPRLANSYISQILHATPNQSGRPRSMVDDVARRIEESLGLPDGWMDQLHSADSSTQPSLSTLHAASNSLPSSTRPTQRPPLHNPNQPRLGRPPSQAKHPRRRSTATIQTPGRPEQPTTLTCTPNTATALDGRSGLRLKKNIIFFTLKA